jgi:hypothetical protein
MNSFKQLHSRRLLRFGSLLFFLGLVSLSMAILGCCGLVLWGLRGADDPS